MGLGDHCPSLSHVADTVSPLQVKLRVDPSSAGDGGVSLRVTLLAGGGLERQVTVENKIIYRFNLAKDYTNCTNIN